MPQVEAGVPLPNAADRNQKVAFLNAMQAGESFKVKAEDVPKWRGAASRKGITLITRKIDSDGTTRIWKQ